MLLNEKEKREFEKDVFARLQSVRKLAEKYRTSQATICRYIERVYGYKYKSIVNKRNGNTTK